MLPLVVLCKYLAFFPSLFLLLSLFPSILSRKNIYLSMNSVHASLHIREMFYSFFFFLFSSLTCSLTVNQCSVGQFLVRLLAYRVCLCLSSIIVQTALSSQAYMQDVCPFWLQNIRLILFWDLCCWNYAVHGICGGNLS